MERINLEIKMLLKIYSINQKNILIHPFYIRNLHGLKIKAQNVF